MARYLIAGCGYVGTALAVRWLAEGHEVLGLRRHWAEPPAGLATLSADLTDEDSLRVVPGDLDGVVYAVAPGERSDAAYARAFDDGLRHLQEVLDDRSPGLDRFVFVSSTAVFAQRDGSEVDEASPTEPTHFSGQRLLAGEGLTAEGPGRGSVVRFGGIYGPGRTGLLERVRRGQASYAPGPPRYTNRIHRDDTVGVLAHLVALEDPPDCLLAVDHEPAPEREVLEWLAEALSAPAPRPRSPAAGSRAALGNRRCLNDRLLATGYTFDFPSYREGYAGLLR